MLVTSPYARTALLLALAALATALMLARVTAAQQQGPKTPSRQAVSLAGHTPGSTAHERHRYRLQVAAAAAAAAAARS